MTIYSIIPPTVLSGTINFKFGADLPSNKIVINMRWIDTHWIGYVTFADGRKREFGVVPMVSSWSRYPDYDILLYCPSPTIGLLDITNTVFYILDKEG